VSDVQSAHQSCSVRVHTARFGHSKSVYGELSYILEAVLGRSASCTGSLCRQAVAGRLEIRMHLTSGLSVGSGLIKEELYRCARDATTEGLCSHGFCERLHCSPNSACTEGYFIRM